MTFFVLPQPFAKVVDEVIGLTKSRMNLRGLTARGCYRGLIHSIVTEVN